MDEKLGVVDLPLQCNTEELEAGSFETRLSNNRKTPFSNRKVDNGKLQKTKGCEDCNLPLYFMVIFEDKCHENVSHFPWLAE